MSARYRFNDFEFNPHSGELRSPDGVVVLQPLPARLLLTLISCAPKVVSREELYRTLWPDTIVEFDLGLNAAVRSLRRSLGDDAGTPTYIETLRRRGYRWIAPVGRVDAARVATRRRTALFKAAAVLAAVATVWIGTGPLLNARSDPLPPELAQLRFLVHHGQEDDLERAIVEFAALPPEMRRSGSGLALEAELHYARGLLDEAERAARFALAVSPTQTDAAKVVGLVHLYRDLDAARAAAWLADAVDRAPQSSDLLHAYGLALAAQGDFDLAMGVMRSAVALDPVSPNLTFDGWLVAYLARDFVTSRSWCDDLTRLTGSDGTRCHLLPLLASGRRGEAAAYAERFLRAHGFTGGDDPSVDAILREYWTWDLGRPRGHLTESQQAFAEARALAQLGRTEEAMDRLRVAATGRPPEMVFARYVAYFDPISSQPSFGALTAGGP